MAVAAAGVLAANALWWQRTWPSWWTGKIGDVAWLAVAPLLVALALALWVGPRHAWRADRVGALALLLTGTAFALVKVVPAANALVVGAFALAGVHAKLALDPSDLLALPGLALAWAAWRGAGARVNSRAPMPGRVSARGPRRAAGLVGVMAAVLAVAADSAAPQPYGVVCVGAAGNTLYAVQEWSAVGYVNATAQQVAHTSTDGGQTWTQLESAQNDPDESPGLRHWCAETAWPLADPADPSRQFWYVDGAGVYATSDGGQTLVLEQSGAALPGGAPSAVFDAATGNLVIAAGRAGVWVRTPAGAWATVAVGEG
jgi:hypothetical protein